MSRPVVSRHAPPADALAKRAGQPANVALGIIAVIALAIRLHGLGRDSLWIDEIRSEWGQYGLPTLHEVRETFGPLDPPLTFVVFRAMGHLPFGLETDLRLIPALAGVGEVVCLAGLLRTLAPRNRALPLVAAALLAVAPFAVRYSQEARYYTVQSALHLATWWVAVRLIRDGRRRDWAAWVGLSVVAVYSHVFAWFSLALQAAVLLLVADRRIRARLALDPPRVVRTLAGVSIVVISFLPWAIWSASYWLTGASSGRDAHLAAPGLRAAAPDLNYANLLSHSLFADTGPGRGLLTVAMACAVAAAPILARGALRRIALGLLLYAFVTIEVTWVLARLARTYLAFRRFEFLLPIFIACVAIALVGLYERLAGTRPSDRRARIAGVTVTAVTATLLVGSLVDTRRVLAGEKTAYRSAAKAVMTAPPNTLIVIGAFENHPQIAWDPLIRKYFDALGVDRRMLSIHSFDSRQVPPSGQVLWITGSPTSDRRFTTDPLNHLDRLQAIGGDRSIGSLIIPLYILRSSYRTRAELAGEAHVVLHLAPVRRPPP